MAIIISIITMANIVINKSITNYYKVNNNLFILFKDYNSFIIHYGYIKVSYFIKHIAIIKFKDIFNGKFLLNSKYAFLTIYYYFNFKYYFNISILMYLFLTIYPITKLLESNY